MKNYEYVGTTAGRKFCINGVDIFANPWRSMGEFDIVLEPQTKKPFSFSRYSVSNGSTIVEFMAGQFREGEWSFFVETEDD